MTAITTRARHLLYVTYADRDHDVLERDQRDIAGSTYSV